MGLVHNRITDWDARRDEFHYVLLKTTCTSSFWAKFKKSKLKKASELKKEKKISARRRELLERGTNINFFFTDIFWPAPRTSPKKRDCCYRPPVTLNKNPVVCFWNVHTGLNSLSSLNSNMKEKNQFFSKVSHYHVDRTLSNKIFDRFLSPFSSRDRIICQNLAFKMLRESTLKLLSTIYSF